MSRTSLLRRLKKDGAGFSSSRNAFYNVPPFLSCIKEMTGFPSVRDWTEMGNPIRNMLPPFFLPR